MQATPTDTLAFAAPGLVHRFGNAIFTIQGHAQLLGDAGPQVPQQAAILGAGERAAATLAVMRSLIGPAGDPPHSCTWLFATIADVLRVPVREAGHTLEVSDEAGSDRLVDGGMFCAAVIEAVRQFVEVLPAGHGGTFEMRLADEGAAALSMSLAFRAKAGSLPFPLPLDALRSRLAATSLPAGDRLRWRLQPPCIRVAFPCTAARPTWKAAEA